MQGVELTEDMLPERYEPDWNSLTTANSERPYMKESFYLLREAAHWLSIISSLTTEASTDINYAVRRGMLIRLTKLMRLMLRELMAEETFQQLSVSRAIIETAATTAYLLEDDGSGERYTQYIQNSLVAEREVLQDIAASVRQRNGEVWDIEERMRRSIDKTAKAANINDVSALPGRRAIGFPSAEIRVKALGAGAYVAYRMGSAEIHGDWTDIYRNHLTFENGEFSPNFQGQDTRPQVPLIIAGVPVFVLEANLSQFTDQPGAEEILVPQLSDLAARIARLNEMHERFLQEL